MAVNRNRSIPSRGSVVRPTKWLSSADQTGVILISAASVLLVSAFTGSQIGANMPAGGTIIRTRGTLWVRSDQTVATEDPVGALGMMVIREQARVAGIAAIPTPVTESFDDGWFLHIPWMAGMTFNQLDATGVQLANLWHRYEFDSKAQRKVTAENSIAVVMENSHASHAAEFLLSFRMLVKPGVSG